MRPAGVLAMTVVLLTAPPLTTGLLAQAEPELPRGNVGFFGGYSVARSDDVEKGQGLGASASFFFSRLLGVEGGVRRQTFDVAGTPGNALSGGELDSNIITANVVVRATAGDIQPYGSAGIAFYSSSFTVDPTLQAQLAEFNFVATETVDNAIGFNAAGGLDFVATRRFGFFVEGRYTAATADTTARLRGQISGVASEQSGELELRLFTVAGGVRIFF